VLDERGSTVIRRCPERALLHSVVRRHLETFLSEVRLRLLATITQRDVIERILMHLGLSTDPVVPEPARTREGLFA